jgi:hypothetical protein
VKNPNLTFRAGRRGEFRRSESRRGADWTGLSAWFLALSVVVVTIGVVVAFVT